MTLECLRHVIEEVNEETIDRFYRALLPLSSRLSRGTVKEALEREGFVIDQRSIRCTGDGSLEISRMCRRYIYEACEVVVGVIGGKLTRTARGTREPVIGYWDITCTLDSKARIMVDFSAKKCSISGTSDSTGEHAMLYLQSTLF